jgi:ribonuclease Z
MKMIYKKYEGSQPKLMASFQKYLVGLGMTEFLPVHVDHCPQSFALVLTHKSGVKISYSGDCRPSKSFAKAAFRSTLMIHEATFGDELLNNAI